MDIEQEIFNSIKYNDIEYFESIINCLTNVISRNFAFIFASKNGNLEILKIFIKKTNINPSLNFNESIKVAFEMNHFEVVYFLWQDKRVKDTLKKDDINLYNKLINKDKIDKF